MISRKCISSIILLFMSVFALNAAEKNEKVTVKLSVSVAKSGAPTLSLKKSPECRTYCLTLFTSDIASMIGDDNMADYFSNQKKQKYTDDIKDKKLVDFGLIVVPEKEYTLISLGYDKDGKMGKVERASFIAPRRQGFVSPEVVGQVIALGPDSVTIKFTPNAEVAGFALCEFEAGTIEKTIEQHGHMMGFSNAYDMIKQFSGKDYTAEKVYTWRGMIPNTPYELCVLPWDKNGIFQEITKVPVTTKKLGGKGEASVSIKIGEFGGSESTGYFQMVVYTPNDQASLHRDLIITEEAFNKPDMGDNGVIKMLQKEIPNDPYWNQYRVDRAQWNAMPNTTYIACSLAKNVDGKWGSLQKVKFTTPAKK